MTNVSLTNQDIPVIEKLIRERLMQIDPTLPAWKTHSVKLSHKRNILFRGQILIPRKVWQYVAALYRDPSLSWILRITDQMALSIVRQLKDNQPVPSLTENDFIPPSRDINEETRQFLLDRFHKSHEEAWTAVNDLISSWSVDIPISPMACHTLHPDFLFLWRSIQLTCPECSWSHAFSFNPRRLINTDNLHPEDDGFFKHSADLIRNLSDIWFRQSAFVHQIPDWTRVESMVAAALSLQTSTDILWTPRSHQAFLRLQQLRLLLCDTPLEPVRYDKRKWKSRQLPRVSDVPGYEHRFREDEAILAADPGILNSKGCTMLQQLWETQGQAVWCHVQKQWETVPIAIHNIPNVKRSYENLYRWAQAWQHPRLSSTHEGYRLAPECEPHPSLEDLASQFADHGMQLINLLQLTLRSFPPNEVIVCLSDILRRHPQKMGAKTLAGILAGSREEKILSKDYAHDPDYGRFRGVYSMSQIITWIKSLVASQYFSVRHVGRYHNPVLYLGPMPETSALKTLDPGDNEEFSADLDTLITRHQWKKLAEKAKDDWAAECALLAGAVLWPYGDARKLREAKNRSHSIPQHDPQQYIIQK